MCGLVSPLQLYGEGDGPGRQHSWAHLEPSLGPAPPSGEKHAQPSRPQPARATSMASQVQRGGGKEAFGLLVPRYCIRAQGAKTAGVCQ